MGIRSLARFFSWALLVSTTCFGPLHALDRCGLVDGVTDGSTDYDFDGDGIVDCLDEEPLVVGHGSCNLVVDTFADGDDGECEVDCTLREALSIPQGELCTILLGAGTYKVDLGSLVLANGTAIVGAGAGVTVIDAETAEPAVVFEYFGTDEPDSMLAGLTLEHNGIGLWHDCGGAVSCALIVTNSIVQGDPAHSAGNGLYFPHDGFIPDKIVLLANAIVRGGAGIRLAGGGGFLIGKACRITGNAGYGVWLGFGYQVGPEAILSDCEVSFNSAGGFYARGALTGPSVGAEGLMRLIRTTVSGNGSTDRGGAIFLENGNFISGGRAEIFDSTIEGNLAAVAGGGIYVEGGDVWGSLRMWGSTLRGNTAPDGAGIFAEPNGRVTLENCTISENVASSRGGAVYDDGGGILLKSSTITLNTAAEGGGIYRPGDPPWPASHLLYNTILGGNTASVSGPDCDGVIGSWGYNLVGDLTDCAFETESTDLTEMAPEMGPLLDNGGPTPTHHPAPESPAINNGLDAESCPDTDQRGVPRPQGERCEIGSVEVAADGDGDGTPDLIDPCPADPDLDGDGYGVGSCPPEADCDDTDATVFPGAREINDGQDNQCPGDAGHGLVDETGINSGFHNAHDKDVYAWPAQPGALGYQVARTDSLGSYSDCLTTATPFLIDPLVPDPGGMFSYLNRAAAPHVGSWGQDSEGAERDVLCVVLTEAVGAYFITRAFCLTEMEPGLPELPGIVGSSGSPVGY